MKKIVLIVLLAFTGITMQAQAFGVKGGFNFSNLKGSGTEDFNVHTSFHVGVLYEIEVFDFFKVQPEILYSQQGAKTRTDDIKLNYFTVPVLAKLYITDGFNVQAGPQFSMLLNESDNFEAYKSETFDFGFTGGLEFFINKGLFVQARYYWGTTEVSGVRDIKNRVVQASLGYVF
ncbi:outer membrane beta-barrel protein [Flavobacterium sp. Sd200]|uniref:porin family protein n=1 Tax=Flavobacterium sp. Sd200 TaxID=2692211 RepID=UPI00136C40F5|nr:porin family protein [Flavobacterium sp. Sd200]MXN89931.1 outer membrane beta-barrel protein [Flavobacterium sp. Sd200]